MNLRKINIFIFVLIILLTQNILFAQEVAEFFPGGLNIEPFKANFLEPRMGFQFRISESDLRLDIGHSTDIVKYSTGSKLTFSLGADFFTFTKLRGEPDFHFPVDAVDYLFGFNFGVKKSMNGKELGARIRISHISAHFVDGHFDPTNSVWRDGRKPIVYSREFLELMPYYQISNLRMYSGLTYIFHVVPKEIGKSIIHAGFEYKLLKVIGEKITPVFAYDFKLVRISKSTGTNSLSAGIKFGNYDEAGLTLMYNYFAGYSIHGEYYDVIEKYSSLNINLEF